MDGYRELLRQVYGQRIKTLGKPGRSPWVVPETVTLTKTLKHRYARGHLVSIKVRAVLEACSEPSGTGHVERLNGPLVLSYT